ncbi:disease resistance protein RUN1-like [Macadamia integrifolia]|uniref:disease resistance protein RUN1-like n=1 Tax=Macadamia integrifolia TaxID=60698 RepID=UPI001C4FCD3A|nr:disease resistance protein RUN1-like [Macadamia integrifolia]
MAASKNSGFASSSSSSSSSYEVFLSFRGEDTRTNFTDHLYHALDDAGINTFRDNEELPTGKKIGPELITAIEQSRIAIPILSENYASSKWCLNEITKIFECKNTMDQVVLPIFYKIEPSAVRNQTGSYAKAFKKHQTCFDHKTVKKWKEALREVGSLKGWDSKNAANGYEAKLIKLVVATVWSTLNKTPSIVSDNLVGIQYHIENMLGLLNIESDDRKIVGINGFGGIGKTTIAKAVYNTIFLHFQGYSFIANVRETAQQHNGLICLQNQLCLDILKQENPYITKVDDGLNVIKQRFRKKKVLIVLDDVDQEIQVNALIGDLEWFGFGTRIIVTSRNKAILIAQKADGIYQPKEMDLHQSLQLFSYHAFRRDQPPEEYLELSKAMVKTTGGLPLALQVVGSSLFCMGKSTWQGTLEKLQGVPNNEVMQRLRISYDGLEYEEKQIFLDTACFFIGMHKDVACYIWEGCNFYPKIGLDVLHLRSLITISEDGYLRMHDQLRDLGREIVRQENFNEPCERSRIWSQEEALNVLNTKMGNRKVECLNIDFEDSSRSQCLVHEGFAKMTELRLLRVDYAHFAKKFRRPFSQLRWLSWTGCPMQFTVTNFDPRKLVVLNLSCSEITEHWLGWNHIKLSRTPDLSANRCLEILILTGCEELVDIDASVGLLGRLRVFDVSECFRIESFSIKLSNLTNLEILNLKFPWNLRKIPSDIEKLAKLKSLKFSSGDFREVPAAFNALTCLESLSFSQCGYLRHISILPSSLTCLRATFCWALTEIPGTNGLESLEILDVSCNNTATG